MHQWSYVNFKEVLKNKVQWISFQNVSNAVNCTALQSTTVEFCAKMKSARGFWRGREGVAQMQHLFFSPTCKEYKRVQKCKRVQKSSRSVANITCNMIYKPLRCSPPLHLRALNLATVAVNDRILKIMTHVWSVFRSTGKCSWLWIVDRTVRSEDKDCMCC